MGKKIVAAVVFFFMITLYVQGCVLQSEIKAEVVAVSRTYSDGHFAYVVLYYSEPTGYDEVYISSANSNHSIEFADSKDALYISKNEEGDRYRLVLTPATYRNAPIFSRER